MIKRHKNKAFIGLYGKSCVKMWKTIAMDAKLARTPVAWHEACAQLLLAVT
jgi:hypothetical protein